MKTRPIYFEFKLSNLEVRTKQNKTTFKLKNKIQLSIHKTLKYITILLYPKQIALAYQTQII